MDVQSFFEDSLRESAHVKLQTIDACGEAVLRAVALIVDCYRNGGKVLFCGNGGSAADAQHLATEMMIRLSHDIQRPPLAAISLSTDSSNLTACGNDLGFSELFARNIQGLGRPGDVLIAISTSGTSPNIIRGVEVARAVGMHVVGMTGQGGGRLRELADVIIAIPSSNTQRIQEAHITIGHVLCETTEQTLYGAT